MGILDEAGELTSGAALWRFAKAHGLKIGSIAELIHCRIFHEGCIRRSGEFPLRTRHGEFRALSYRDHYQGQLHLARVQGEPRGDRPTLARIAAEGCGALVLLAQQAFLEQLAAGGRPRLPQFAQRTLGIGAQILRDLDVWHMRLLRSLGGSASSRRRPCPPPAAPPGARCTTSVVWRPPSRCWSTAAPVRGSPPGRPTG